MSETGAKAEPGPEDLAYFQALEEELARLRGAALLLAPADWEAALEWRRRGVPLELVRATMAEVYARRQARVGRQRRIHSLRYFAPAVEAAWEEYRALTAAGRRLDLPPLDPSARLAALAAALPPALPERAAWAARIQGLLGGAAEIERGLAALEEELLAAAAAGLDVEAREALGRAQQERLRALAGRLPKAEVEAARAQLERRLLRERLGLPVLSLFSPQAGGA